MAQVCEPPALIAVMGPRAAGGVACPSLLEPQQAAVLSLLMAHMSLSPALIALTVAVSAVLCPYELSPQQAGLPSLRTAHVWKRPVVRAVTVPKPAGARACP